MACATTDAARGYGVAAFDLTVGNRGDLVLVEAATAAAAVVTAPMRRLVVARGRIMARGCVPVP